MFRKGHFRRIMSVSPPSAGHDRGQALRGRYADAQGTCSRCGDRRAGVADIVVAAAADARSEKATATTVTLSGWSAGKTEDDLLQQIVDDFNSTHPAIHVDYSVINGDYATAMTARFAARNPPDVFYVDSSIAPTWIKQGVVQPLNSYIKKSKYDTSKFYPGLLNAFKVGKNVLRLPEGLVAARRGDQQVDVRQGGDQEGAPDLGRADRRRPEACFLGRRTRTASRSASRPTGRGCWRSSSRTRARSRSVQSPAVAAAVNYYVGLLQEGPRGDAHPARSRLAR